MAGRGLLSRLGDVSSASSLRAPSEVDQVLANLRFILNTRRGESPSSPELGIPSVVDFVHAFPGAVPIMQRQIRQAVIDFEPRLTKVVVRYVPADNPLVIHFEIAGELLRSGTRVRFQTRVSPGGQVNIT